MGDCEILEFQVLTNGDLHFNGPRLGRLSIPGRNVISTPNFLAITSRGVIPHMTPDVVSSTLSIEGIHLALEDFIEQKSSLSTVTPPILSCPAGESPDSTPIHKFTALPLSIVTLLAPRRSPAITTPNPNTDSSISIYTSTGFQNLALDSYIKACSILRPDVLIPMADLTPNLTPGSKRLDKMGDRTRRFVSSQLEALSSSSSGIGPSGRRQGQLVFAPILPISYAAQSEYLDWLADEKSEEITGLAFYDADLIAEIPATSVMVQKCRLSLDEAPGPLRVLKEISWGVDVFACPFVSAATDRGVGLDFQFPARKRDTSDDDTQAGDGKSRMMPLGTDMWSHTHAESLSPLSEHCDCYTCQTHHRAYIQHLLSAKEMLGWVLLQIHNHHMTSHFFAGIRDSITAGSFEEDCAEFEVRYEPDLPHGGGTGPRVRGYHFKSEGPTELKKNAPAWGSLSGGPEQADGPLVPDVGGEALEEKGFAEVVG